LDRRTRVAGVAFLFTLCTSLRAASSALWRNACSEESENCETTIAVEVAATTAKAAPSHQRTPTEGLNMWES
jgi:hypothetical protein